MMMNGFGSSSPSTDIDAKEVIHVEILKKRQSSASNADLENVLLHHLTRDGNVVTDATLTEEVLPLELRSHITSVRIIKDDTTFNDYKHVNCSKAELQFHTYSLEDSGPDTEELPGTEDDHQEPIPAATQWLLPSTEFHNLWDNLIFDSDIKNELLSYVSTALMFSDCGINPNIISWNRVVLLHGPPGTGKTSLCRALAHQLSIRLGHRYSYAQLIEINSHSLFSKWFSESGKLVQRLFSRLQEMADDPSCLVCVLVDEVESLARSRCSESASSEPGDAVRVVNALLTQLDHIKRNSNVLILTTSNVSGTIDLAFVDRADIKRYIGLPSQAAIYQIYFSCIKELERGGLVSVSRPLMTLRELQLTDCVSDQLQLTVRHGEDKLNQPSILLWQVAGKSVGLSGRSLRKLPFLTYVQRLRRPPHTLEAFIAGLEASAAQHALDSQQIAQHPAPQL